MKESTYDRVLITLTLLAPLLLFALNKWRASLDVSYAPLDAGHASYFGERFTHYLTAWLASGDKSGPRLIVVADGECPCTRAALRSLEAALAQSNRKDIYVDVRYIDDADPQGDPAAWKAVLSELPATPTLLAIDGSQHASPARVGFQVHFVERTPDCMAIGGRLLSHQSPTPDVATIDICAMDAAWPKPVRKQVIENVLAAMARACGQAQPSPAWWVTFRVIDDGSWGSRGSVLSILDLLASGVFTPERTAEIRRALDCNGRSSGS